MSTESIIGIVSGSLGIATFLYGCYRWIQKKMEKRPMIELFKELMKKELHDTDRRKILKKLNTYPLINYRIKADYIEVFELGNRGPEAVLQDIFISNDIEPTDDLCKEIYGVKMPSWQAKYAEKKKNNTEIKTETSFVSEEKIMTENPSNRTGDQIVFMSELLKRDYPDTCGRLVEILQRHQVNFKFLKGTEDIWCRDYMPVQNRYGKLIQFRYEPSYLTEKEEWKKSISDVEKVCQLNNLTPEPSKINLDGGNVLICDDRAIISKRIYEENPDLTKEYIDSELERLLECEVIMIPAYAKKYDMTGHADGMVRFVDRNTIIGNKLENEFANWRKEMQEVIAKYNLKYIDVPLLTDMKDRKHPLSAQGVYVNFLEVNNLIVLPIFGRPEDDEVIKIMKETFPDRVIEPIDYNDVALEGGLVNCTTWVMRK